MNRRGFLLGAAAVTGGLVVGYRGWAGSFERPADWRRTHAAEPETAAPPSRIAAFLNWVENVFAR